MVSVGVTLQIYFKETACMVFWFLGMFAFYRGVYLYEAEARAELEKKRKKDAQKQE